MCRDMSARTSVSGICAGICEHLDNSYSDSTYSFHTQHLVTTVHCCELFRSINMVIPMLHQYNSISQRVNENYPYCQTSRVNNESMISCNMTYSSFKIGSHERLQICCCTIGFDSRTAPSDACVCYGNQCCVNTLFIEVLIEVNGVDYIELTNGSCDTDDTSVRCNIIYECIGVTFDNDRYASVQPSVMIMKDMNYAHIDMIQL